MKTTRLKTILCLIVMISLVTVTFFTNDIVNIKLFASLAIFTGALTCQNLLTYKHMNNE